VDPVPDQLLFFVVPGNRTRASRSITLKKSDCFPKFINLLVFIIKKLSFSCKAGIAFFNVVWKKFALYNVNGTHN
jgi:hypothetical protein